MKRSPTTQATTPLVAVLLLAACQTSGDAALGGPLPTDQASAALIADPVMDSASRDSFASASSAPGAQDGAPAGAGPSERAAQNKASKKSAGPTLKELQAQLTKAQEEKVEAQREQRYAEAELEIAVLEAAGAELGIVESLRAARAEVEEARRGMERFDSLERPLEQRESALTLAQATERLHVAETDLVGIVQIFAEETEARAKDEIIRRHETKVAEAKERLAIAQEKHDVLVEHALPARMRKKAEALHAAQAALETAEASAEEKRRRSELAVEKATDAADDAKRDARKAGRKVDTARKRVNDKREARSAPTKKDSAAVETPEQQAPEPEQQAPEKREKASR